VQFVKIHARFDRAAGNLTMALCMPNGTILSTSKFLSNTTEAIELPIEFIPIFGNYTLRIEMNSSVIAPPLIHDLAITLTTAFENATLPPINTVPMPHPSREFYFLPPADLDPFLLSGFLIAGIGVGGGGVFLLLRRFKP
ncbi:MAG: hypothetical protein ACFFB3_11575, partial [Candidatus Hodarchaeota archaeon]